MDLSADEVKAPPADAQPSDGVFDALPYVDAHILDPALKHQVDQLLSEEMGRSTKTVQQYRQEVAEKYPPLELKHLEGDLVRGELERITKGKEQPKLNWKVEPPAPAEQGNPEAWEREIRRAQAQLENHSTWIENLELSKKRGADAWKAHIEQLLQMRDSLAHVINKSKKEIEAINRKRKAEQMEAKPLLDSLERQFYELASKNHEIETVCWALERELKKGRPAGERESKRQSASATADSDHDSVHVTA